MILNFSRKTWFFSDNPKKNFQFVKAKFQSYDIQEHSNLPKLFLVRPEEGEVLSSDQKSKLNALLIKIYFVGGGEKTNLIEHRFDTGAAPPVVTTPYRLSPARQEDLRKEIDALLASEIIEECDSLYAAPVVFIPKPNG